MTRIIYQQTPDIWQKNCKVQTKFEKNLFQTFHKYSTTENSRHKTTISLKGLDMLANRSRSVWFWTSLRGPLQNRKSLARRINNLFLVLSKKYTVTYSHAIPNMAKIGWKIDLKYWKWRKNTEIRCRTCMQSISVFCHKRTQPWKLPQLSVYVKNCAAASVDEKENFVTPEVGRHTYTLHKSILAVNSTDTAPFIREPMFQIWWRSVENWAC